MSRRRYFHREDGQTLVEFTIIVPLLAAILFGIIQFGITFNNYLTLTDAVRAGARKAAVSRNLGPTNATNAVKQAVVDSSADIGLKSDAVTVDSTWQPGGKVTVSATFPYKIDLLGFVFASGNLKSITSERVE